MILPTLFLLSQSIIIPSAETNVCNYNTSNECINEFGCGWCNYTKNQPICKYVGVCYLNTNITKMQCEVETNQVFCELSRIFLFFIVLGTTISVMSCGFVIIRRIISNMPYQILCYYILLIIVLSVSVLPSISFYYLTSIDFIIITSSLLFLSILFWIYYGGENVRKIYINRTHSEYSEIENEIIN
tara:strand:- start:688 stop:1245 length:558 start_codon:yes stop_codon:yes gene_type:complete